jgi:hypothetical protein
VRFAVGSAQTLGDVEDDVGAGVVQPEGEVVGGVEPHDGAEAGERALDGGDGDFVIPLGVEVVEGNTRRLFGFGGDADGVRGGVAGRLLVEGEPDAKLRTRLTFSSRG